ncbi:MAG: ribokinase [Pseudomonadota bacterium]
MPERAKVAVLGIYNTDLAFEAQRLPAVGETLLGDAFRMGPGGKGSNQVIAAAKAGANAAFITRIGADPFGEIAQRTWRAAGVDTGAVIIDPERSTGAAFIFVSTQTGDNAIIVESGAARVLSAADAEGARATIAAADVFITQLEQPLEAATRGLEIARAAGVTTILNPAPAAELSDAMLATADYITPNESEAAHLTGRPVDSVEEARVAADALLARGVGAAVLTLGSRGALYHTAGTSELVPALTVETVRDTTGAGDAFNGAFATALGEGRSPLEAVRFAAVAASLSVTRSGAAGALATRDEIDARLTDLS